jgi:hypothetical protein
MFQRSVGLLARDGLSHARVDSKTVSPRCAFSGPFGHGGRECKLKNLKTVDVEYLNLVVEGHFLETRMRLEVEIEYRPKGLRIRMKMRYPYLFGQKS